jgi:hypothetical protein
LGVVGAAKTGGSSELKDANAAAAAAATNPSPRRKHQPESQKPVKKPKQGDGKSGSKQGGSG